MATIANLFVTISITATTSRFVKGLTAAENAADAIRINPGSSRGAYRSPSLRNDSWYVVSAMRRK